uniref:G_PROTEIN_RECEP_F1_2 domain-containing protein n=1 Tax=Caenorhabditis tropicalis TaxID=1561998 RepID=A0A1I7UK36_9PELO
MDSSSLCLPETQLRLSGSNLEAFLYTVLFPPICLFGVVGNALTILVLVNNDFMSRLVVGVCFERVAGVRSPLHRLTTPSRGKLTTGLLSLLTFCAALTFYNHVSHHCFIKSFCNASQIMAVCLDVNLDVWPNNRTNISPPALRTYVAATRAANAALVVFLPMILLVVLNMMLLYYVKKRSFFMYASLGRVSARMRKAGDVALPFVGTLFRRHSDQILQQRTEHRVAVTVCAVVTSFTITQAPSAVVLTVNSLLKERLDAHWYHMTTITSFLVVIGKSLNFVVFCLSSSSFRRRLINTLRSKYGSRDEKRSHSINTTYTRCDSRDSRILSQKKSFQSI